MGLCGAEWQTILWGVVLEIKSKKSRTSRFSSYVLEGGGGDVLLLSPSLPRLYLRSLPLKYQKSPGNFSGPTKILTLILVSIIVGFTHSLMELSPS
jgi:hypothetical protein